MIALAIATTAGAAAAAASVAANSADGSNVGAGYAIGLLLGLLIIGGMALHDTVLKPIFLRSAERAEQRARRRAEDRAHAAAFRAFDDGDSEHGSTCWRARFQQQEGWRLEGERAAKAGKLRADCPYDRKTQSEEWNFWVYGCENEHGRVAWEKAGRPMYST